VFPASGLRLRPPYDALDADFMQASSPGIPAASLGSPSICISGRVLQGLDRPTDCPSFGVACTPERPLGAPMVSAEGACAAYWHYRQRDGSAAAGVP